MERATVFGSTKLDHSLGSHSIRKLTLGVDHVFGEKVNIPLVLVGVLILDIK
jgi:hypothetical protein